MGEDKLTCNTFAIFSLSQPFFLNKCYSDSHKSLLIFTILACVLSAFLEQIYSGPGFPILEDHPGPVGLKCRVPTSL